MADINNKNNNSNNNGMNKLKVNNEVHNEIYDKWSTQIKARKIRMAICYDFDKTLAPDDMQTFTLIPSFGINKDEFWQESNKLAIKNLMDNNLAWMYELIKYSKFKGKSLKREYFREIGADVKLYNGVESWFERVTKYAAKQDVELEHYIISSGLKEIIEGSKIAGAFKRIYASSYMYSPDGIAEWPAQAINYTNKTQYIFRIAKGFLEEYDERVNDSVPDEQLRIPYENIVYIGDSITDVPCMRLVKSKGGYSIGVYDPDKDNRARVYQLYNDGRLSFYAPADYSARSDLFKYMKQIIDEVAAKEKIKTEQLLLNRSAGVFKLKTMLQTIESSYPQKMSKKDKKELNSIMKGLNELLPGNVE